MIRILVSAIVAVSVLAGCTSQPDQMETTTQNSISTGQEGSSIVRSPEFEDCVSSIGDDGAFDSDFKTVAIEDPESFCRRIMEDGAVDADGAAVGPDLTAPPDPPSWWSTKENQCIPSGGERQGCAEWARLSGELDENIAAIEPHLENLDGFADLLVDRNAAVVRIAVTKDAEDVLMRLRREVPYPDRLWLAPAKFTDVELTTASDFLIYWLTESETDTEYSINSVVVHQGKIEIGATGDLEQLRVDADRLVAIPVVVRKEQPAAFT